MAESVKEYLGLDNPPFPLGENMEIGTARGGSPVTIQLQDGLPTSALAPGKSTLVVLWQGPGSGQVAFASAYDSDSNTIMIHGNWIATPEKTTKYLLIHSDEP